MADYGPDVEDARQINTTRLWAGGLATAVVAALVVLAGALIVGGILGVQVPAPEESGAPGGAGTAVYAALAALGALVATGLLHLLLLNTPRPLKFFSWIVGLATVVAAVTPFTQGASPAGAVATSLVNLAAGAVILSLLSSVGGSARPRRRVRRRPTRSDGSPPGSGYSGRHALPRPTESPENSGLRRAPDRSHQPRN